MVVNNLIPCPGQAVYFTNMELRLLLKEEKKNNYSLHISTASSFCLEQIYN